MNDDLLPLGGGNEPVEEPSSPTPDTPTEIARLSRENQKWRTQLRETQAQLKELQPLAEQFKATQEAQKTEAQKLADQLAEATRKAQESDNAAQRAVREAKAIRLMTKAGVDPDLLDIIDLNKLDLDNEEEALKQLAKLPSASAKQTANSASNPGRTGAAGADEAELRRIFFGGGRNQPTIFGGR
jgi:predicted RNase H-like nuclease (RuvC/YqgF family)